MTFEEFLSKRLADVLRFALVLCGNRELSSELATAALIRSRDTWDGIVAAGSPFAAVRTSMVREYLSGATRAVEVTVLDDPALAGEIGRLGWDGLANRFRVLSKRQRAVTCLRYYSGLSEADTAATIGGSGLTGIRADLASARIALSIRGGETALNAPAGQTVEALEGLLELISEETAVDTEAILDRLESSTPVTGVVAEPARTGSAEAPEAGAVPPAALTERSADAAESVTAGPRGTAPPEEASGDRPGLSWVDIVDDPPPAPEPAPAAVPPPRGARRTRRRLLMALGAVLVLGAAVAIATVGSADDQPRPVAGTSTPSAENFHGLPAPMRQPLPGTTVLAEYGGTGTATLSPAARRVRSGYELVVAAVCSGAGPVQVGRVAMASCAAPAAGQVSSADVGSVEIRAPARTAWRVAVLEQPQTETNGALANPPDPSIGDVHIPGVLTTGHGIGSATVRLPGVATAASAQALRISVVCHGDGVVLSSPDGAADGNYTHTCFAGWSYQFEITGARLPGALRVTASARTTWRLSVVLI
jgi:DNA-directed RNA polymerase specialized sigma24 family protein